MIEAAIDVVLQSTGAFSSRFELFQEMPPIDQDFQLSPEITVGLLPEIVTGDQVMDACRPTGFNFSSSRLYGYLYAFIRTIDPSRSPSLNWDDDGLLSKVLFVSKLIHPTTAAGCYSARLLTWNGELRQIVPGQTQGLGAYSYIVAEQWRDWLTLDELKKLRDCLPLYISRTPSERVRQARRHIDHAFHGFYLDQRITSVVTALEGLLKVGRGGESKQFKNRVPQLAKLVGETIRPDEAWSFYDERSGIVHGTGPNWTELGDDLIAQYQLFERTLRLALLRASTEPEFAEFFCTDDSVKRAFPI